MTRTTVVNLKSGAPFDVYIGRARGARGYFGNPYTVAAYGREEALRLYRRHFRERMATDAEFRRRVEALRGQTLGCFCKPAHCHGDVIAAYLNGDGWGL